MIAEAKHHGWRLVVFMALAIVLMYSNSVEAFLPLSLQLQQHPKTAVLFENSAAVSIPKETSSTIPTEKEEEEEFLQESFESTSPQDVLPGTAGAAPAKHSARFLPLGLVVGHDFIKQALVVAATSPACSVIIEGRRGTCKSVLARSVHRLIPPTLRRVKDSPYNVDPQGHTMDSFLFQHLQETGESLSDLETELIDTPFVTVPLGVAEDALLGSVDLEQSLETGRTEFLPGLLAKANRGILYIDEINLLDDQVASLLFQAIADGFVTVEREGLSVRYPCQPLVLATFNPAEGELREHLMDRFGLHLSADEHVLSVQDRVQAVRNVEAFAGTTQPSEVTSAQVLLERVEREETDLRESIAKARDLLPKVEISKKQLLYLCETATRADCQGQRAEVYATMVAKASAALGGRTHVTAHDLELAVLLAIAPRGRFLMEAGLEDVAGAPPPSPAPQNKSPPAPLPPDMDFEHPEEKPEEEEENPQETKTEDEREQDPEEESEETTEEELQIPLEFMFGVDATPIDPRLLIFAKRTRRGKGGRRSQKHNIERGRFVKAIFPKGNNRGRLAVGATLRAAAPHQLARRRRIPRTVNDRRKVFVLADDFRIQQLKRKSGSLIIFVVDASGSMALNRMAAAKGSAIALLQEAYKSRDKICLIACHGDASDVLVPPTKSVALASKRLEAIPCGSKTPLAHALTVAMRTGLNAIKVKQDSGRVIIVLISDGRGNVPLCVSYGNVFDASTDPKKVNSDGSPSRAFLKEEILAIAKQIGALEAFDILCIDTEDKFVKTGFGKEIAKVAQGNYYHLGRADSKSILRAVETATQ